MPSRRFRQTAAAANHAELDAYERAAGDTGTFWLQARAGLTRSRRDNAALDFTQRAFGLAAGADARWDFASSSLATGIFADTARTLRDFSRSADGSTVAVGGGLHAQWSHRTGLHLAAIARLDTFKNTLDTHSPANALAADYNTQAFGLALEAARRFRLPAGWWLEPALHLSLAKFPTVTYATRSNKTSNLILITIDDARATQTLLRLALGKPLDDNWSLRAHLAAAKVAVNGGKFSAARDQPAATGNKLAAPDITQADFTIDGARAEASLGIERRVGRASRLTLDAAFTAASDYTRPFTLALGYNLAW
jgi:outer membrane autotransporter protein